MNADFKDIESFVAVANAGGFRDAARATGGSASSLSAAVRRLEAQLGVRLLNRTTRNVVVTEVGARLLTRLSSAIGEMKSALDLVNDYRGTPRGSLKLSVSVNAARVVLPRILPAFLAAYPEVNVEVMVNTKFVDVLASGCDAGIHYEECVEEDMIAVPIGPRVQRFATAASPAYLHHHGRPTHPNDLAAHACLPGRFGSGAIATWEFEKDGEVLHIEPSGPLVVSLWAMDLVADAAIAGNGIVQMFEHRLRPYMDSGHLEPVLENWWKNFAGPFLYYPGRKYLPAPLRAFVDFNNQQSWER